MLIRRLKLTMLCSCTPLTKDDFNLTGLNGLVPYYDYALDMVLDVEMPMEDSLTEVSFECARLASVVCTIETCHSHLIQSLLPHSIDRNNKKL